MCGLTGVLSRQLPGRDDVEGMADTMLSRGPDEGGVWIDKDSGIALGHRRLSIIDLSPAGRQPMFSACGRYVIAYNGEIYNHLELRHQLEKAGKEDGRWRGHSDTETLLACLSAWGFRRTLELVVGMFAWAVWDRVERRLYLARDRLGEKPLYYGWIGHSFVFSSELKALRRYPGFDNPVDRDVLSLYMRFSYVPAPYSIYRDIYKLEPGCFMTLSLDDVESRPSSAMFAPARQGGISLERYWSVEAMVQDGLNNSVREVTDAVNRLEAALSRSVGQQSVADVPLGAFLSGGIDSSTVVSLMQSQARKPVKTFTVGFDQQGFNEADYAKAVAAHLGTDHTELYVSPRETMDVIPDLPGLYCEPFADSSQIPSFLISKMARQQVKVALSGDGGDELFGGYNRYFWAEHIWKRVGWMPHTMRRILGACIHRVPAATWDSIGTVIPGMSGVARLGEKAHKLAYRLEKVIDQDDLYRSLVSVWNSDSGVVRDAGKLDGVLDRSDPANGVSKVESRMMIYDTLTYLPDDILHKVDRASMGVSLETRAPFLDYRVAELAWQLPLDMKIRDGVGKWILRQVLYRYVPRQLIDRPKSGFGIPISFWLRGPLKEWAEDLLSEQNLAYDGLLNTGVVRSVWHQHLAGTHDWSAKIWTILMFQAWSMKGKG